MWIIIIGLKPKDRNKNSKLAIIRDMRTEINDYEIERQKYCDEYLNECTAARKAETADYLAATAEENTFLDTHTGKT